MVRIRELQTPVGKEQLATLASGDLVNLSGSSIPPVMRPTSALWHGWKQGNRYPLRWRTKPSFTSDPAPHRRGKIIGSCGPTTSSRMDPYTPLLLEQGLKIAIGKGPRSQEVVQAIPTAPSCLPGGDRWCCRATGPVC